MKEKRQEVRCNKLLEHREVVTRKYYKDQKERGMKANTEAYGKLSGCVSNSCGHHQLPSGYGSLLPSKRRAARSKWDDGAWAPSQGGALHCEARKSDICCRQQGGSPNGICQIGKIPEGSLNPNPAGKKKSLAVPIKRSYLELKS